MLTRQQNNGINEAPEKSEAPVDVGGPDPDEVGH